MECQQFSIKIKKICKSKGMTIKELLEKCGISRNFVYAIEKNNQIPSVDKVEKIADQLDCSVDYLLGRTDNPNITENPELNNMGDVTRFLYNLFELNELKLDLKIINDHLDIETETEKVHAVVDVYCNVKNHQMNADLYNILKSIDTNLKDLERYEITLDIYERKKKADIDYYKMPVSRKVTHNLSGSELLAKRIEYLEAEMKEKKAELNKLLKKETNSDN